MTQIRVHADWMQVRYTVMIEMGRMTGVMNSTVHWEYRIYHSNTQFPDLNTVNSYPTFQWFSSFPPSRRMTSQTGGPRLKSSPP